MGWTGQQHDGRPTAEIVTEEIEWHSADQPQRHRVVARSGKYYAVETIATGDVWALVALSNRDKYWVYTKLVDETMGPYNYDCPKRILDLLTELPDEAGYDHAREWREKCREQLELKANQPKLKPGDRIRIPNGVTFVGDWTATDFTFEGRYTFRADNGIRVRLPKNWKWRYTWEKV